MVNYEYFGQQYGDIKIGLPGHSLIAQFFRLARIHSKRTSTNIIHVDDSRTSRVNIRVAF